MRKQGIFCILFFSNLDAVPTPLDHMKFLQLPHRKSTLTTTCSFSYAFWPCHSKQAKVYHLQSLVLQPDPMVSNYPSVLVNSAPYPALSIFSPKFLSPLEHFFSSPYVQSDLPYTRLSPGQLQEPLPWSDRTPLLSSRSLLHPQTLIT